MYYILSFSSLGDLSLFRLRIINFAVAIFVVFLLIFVEAVWNQFLLCSTESCQLLFTGSQFLSRCLLGQIPSSSPLWTFFKRISLHFLCSRIWHFSWSVSDRKEEFDGNLDRLWSRFSRIGVFLNGPIKDFASIGFQFPWFYSGESRSLCSSMHGGGGRQTYLVSGLRRDFRVQMLL